MKRILFSFYIMCFFGSMSAQIVVKPNLSAVVGDTNGIPNAKLNVNAQDKTYGFAVNSNVTNGTYKDTSLLMGIYNQFNTSTLGIQSPYNFPSRSAYKSQNNTRKGVYNNGVFINTEEILGSGAPLNGIETNGISNVITGAQNNYNGMFNSYYTLNCTEAKGFGNFFTQLQNGVTPTNLNTNFYGVYNWLQPNSSSYSYGVFNLVNVQPSFTGVTYGLYSKIDGDSTNGVRYGIYSDVTPVSSTKGYAGYFKGRVQVEGSFLQTSDEKLKENIELISNATSIVKQIQPKRYDLISEGRDARRRKHYGVVAQDLEKILPDLVLDTYSPGETKVESTTNDVEDIDYVTDSNGKLQKVFKKRKVTSSQIKAQPPTPVKAVNYIELISILIQTVKEQQDVIEQLQKDVQILKNR